MTSGILVFLGGGIGSLCRYALGLWVQPWQERYPAATLVANGLACVVLGAVLGLHAAHSLPARWRLLLGTGFCGGFSTFSTFTSETWQLWQGGHHIAALVNVLVNLAVCMIAFLIGWKMTA